MAAHYQPNLDVVRFGAPPPARVLGFVREGSIEDGPNIFGAQILLESGQQATSGQNGLYLVPDVAPGPNHLTVTAGGYQTWEQDIEVAEGIDNWFSVALTAEGGGDGSAAADAGPGDGGSDLGESDTGSSADAASDLAPSDAAGGGDSGGEATVSPLPRFAVVGQQGLDSGCQSSPGSGSGSGWMGWLAASALALASLRRAGRSSGA
jgi:MYXO-CTERM domain-containing protein